MNRPRWPGTPDRLLQVPELNLFVFAFLLHFPLELWMMGSTLPADPHAVARGEVAKICTVGATAHALVTIAAFWIVSTAGRSRGWVRAPLLFELAIFALVSAVFAALAEAAAGLMLEEWAHTGTVTTFGKGGLGIPTMLQGIVAPLATIWFVSRQLRGGEPVTRDQEYGPGTAERAS